jgi:hypothetical protein
MKKFILLGFLLITALLQAQDNIHRKVFLDSSYSVCLEKDHAYYRIIKSKKNSENNYIVTDYYKTGTIKTTGFYCDNEAKVKNGEFNYYYENGKKRLQNFFKNSKILEPYTEWYENGNKSEVGTYILGNKEWHDKLIINFWNNNNIQTVTNGVGIFEMQSKTENIQGKIIDGIRQGVWIGSESKHKITFEEKYKKGKLVSGKSVDSLNIERTYNKIFEHGEPKKGKDHFTDYIGKNIQELRLSGKLTDKLVLGLNVNNQGKLIIVKTIKSVNYSIDETLIEIVNNYNEIWIPAKYRGVNIDHKFAFPIQLDFK